MNLLALLDRRANDAQSGSVAAGGQCAGVAVRQDAALIGHKRRAKCAHRLAGGNVFGVHCVRFGQDFHLDLGQGRARCGQVANSALHAVDGPEEIHRRGAGCGQPGADAFKLRANSAVVAALVCFAPSATP
jgi:hypothetical protein